MSLLDVGTENLEHEIDNTTALLDEEVTFGAFEAGMVETSELSTGLERLIKTADALGDTLEDDMVGKESNTITADSVQRQLSELHHVLELGIDDSREIVAVGTESINKDPLGSLEVGREAKEGMIKEIIRKAKDFIKMIINSIKKYASKIAAAVKTLTMNITKLKDLAEDNEDDFKLDAKEDAKVHNRFRDIVGEYQNNDKMVTIAGPLDSMVAAYAEPTSKEADEVLKSIKDSTSLTGFLTSKATQEIKQGATIPATSTVRALLDKTQVGVGALFLTADALQMVVLTKSGKGKKEKWKVNTGSASISSKAYKYDFTYTADEIKSYATAVATHFDKYPVQEVVNAVYERLDILDKHVSDETKTAKKTTVSKMMKFTAYTNKVGSLSIKTVIKNQKTAYSILKLMVTEAGN